MKFLAKLVLIIALIGGVFWLKEKQAIKTPFQQSVKNVTDSSQLQGQFPVAANPQTTDFKWTYAKKNYELNETLYGSANDYYGAQSKQFEYQGDLPADWKEKYFAMFLRVAPGDAAIANLAEDIKQAGLKNNLSHDQIAELVLSFVQAIPYDDAKAKLILAGDSSAQVNYPYETLYSDKGVCSDKSFLADLLLHDLGYGTALFVYDSENHMAVAVQCPAKDSSYGSGYCYAETTAVGEKIGMIPDLNAQNNQAQGVQKLDYFSNSQGQFDVKKLGPVGIFEKTSGQLYSGVAATMQTSQQIETLGGWITDARGQLIAQNAKINADRATLSGMDKNMQKFSKAKDYKNYNELVPQYNNLINALQKEIISYNAQVNAYNQKVKNYNNLVASF